MQLRRDYQNSQVRAGKSTNMAAARYVVLFIMIAALVSGSSAASVGRKLSSYYHGTEGGSASSSPSTSAGGSPSYSTPTSDIPYSSTPSSGSSATSSTPASSTSYPTSPSSGSSPSTTPVTSSPTPVTSYPTPAVFTPSGKGTCDYWKRNPGKVPKVLSLLSSLGRAFGPRALKLFGKHLTLLSAIKLTETDPVSSLAREGSASLINAYAYNEDAAAVGSDDAEDAYASVNSASSTAVSFPLSASNVISLFNAAMETPESAAKQAAQFQRLNEAV